MHPKISYHQIIRQVHAAACRFTAVRGYPGYREPTQHRLPRQLPEAITANERLDQPLRVTGQAGDFARGALPSAFPFHLSGISTVAMSYQYEDDEQYRWSHVTTRLHARYADIC